MTFDPYTNRIPAGLLTDDEKAALLATGGPWEYRDPRYGVWNATSAPGRYGGFIYRAVRKPLPVPQEGDVWLRPYEKGPRKAVLARGVSVETAVASGWRLFREVKA
jgi:hypothetical protein